MTVEPVTPADLPDVRRMLQELANYEEIQEPVCSTVESLHTAMFGERLLLYGYIARR
jgi:hypothetical protein